MKSRFTAFLTHFFASIAVALMAAAIVFFIWYPSPLQHTSDVTKIFFLFMLVHMTIGPVLTLLIFQPQKKLLALDLSIIAILQLVTLGYGLYIIFQGRPAFIIFAQDRFETVSTLDINPESRATALADGNTLVNASWLGPVWAATQAPKNTNRATEILFSTIQGGPDWPQLPELYTPIINLKGRMLEKSQSLQELRNIHKDKIFGINNQLANYKDNNVKWLPLHGDIKNMIVLINANSAEVIKVMNINPYPDKK